MIEWYNLYLKNYRLEIHAIRMNLAKFHYISSPQVMANPKFGCLGNLVT
jgi:hypothetical protein